MELKRVVITGLGALTPIGNDVATTWENAKAGKSGASPITGSFSILNLFTIVHPCSFLVIVEQNEMKVRCYIHSSSDMHDRPKAWMQS